MREPAERAAAGSGQPSGGAANGGRDRPGTDAPSKAPGQETICRVQGFWQRPGSIRGARAPAGDRGPPVRRWPWRGTGGGVRWGRARSCAGGSISGSPRRIRRRRCSRASAPRLSRLGGVRRTASSLECVRMLVSCLPLIGLTSRSLSRRVLADDHALVDLDAGIDHHRPAVLEVPQRVGHGGALRRSRSARRCAGRAARP